MKVIVGLGNPERRYRDTPHNVGFRVVDVLADRAGGCRLRRSWRFRARVGDASIAGERALLVQPQTYMNRSGLAIGALLRYHKRPVSDLMVVLDDADLEMGCLRLRRKGSSGGHRGLESVIEQLGTSEFLRVRVGVGRDLAGGSLYDYVLRPLAGVELDKLCESAARAADAVACVIEKGPDAAMNAFNS
ncbi:MAG: aminoacyl-tRNA hydrolase [Kiritimatiellae bacterium]|nr:aminoacyl-tRNA hydrolase [Kiritimatiellia bacterium]